MAPVIAPPLESPASVYGSRETSPMPTTVVEVTAKRLNTGSLHWALLASLTVHTMVMWSQPHPWLAFATDQPEARLVFQVSVVPASPVALVSEPEPIVEARPAPEPIVDTLPEPIATPPEPKPIAEIQQEPVPEPIVEARPEPKPAAAAVVASRPPPAPPQPAAASRSAPTAPPAAAANPPPTEPVEEGFIDARALHSPRPDYPRQAQRRGLQGQVVLQVQVLANGQPGHIEVLASSGHAVLDQAALESLKQWRFEPARRGGQAVVATLRVPVRFELH